MTAQQRLGKRAVRFPKHPNAPTSRRTSLVAPPRDPPQKLLGPVRYNDAPFDGHDTSLQKRRKNKSVSFQALQRLNVCPAQLQNIIELDDNDDDDKNNDLENQYAVAAAEFQTMIGRFAKSLTLSNDSNDSYDQLEAQYTTAAIECRAAIGEFIRSLVSSSRTNDFAIKNYTFDNVPYILERFLSSRLLSKVEDSLFTDTLKKEFYAKCMLYLSGQSIQIRINDGPARSSRNIPDVEFNIQRRLISSSVRLERHSAQNKAIDFPKICSPCTKSILENVAAAAKARRRSRSLKSSVNRVSFDDYDGENATIELAGRYVVTKPILIEL